MDDLREFPRIFISLLLFHSERCLPSLVRSANYAVCLSSQKPSVVKNLPANAEDADVGSIPELGRSPGVGNGSLLQYPCLENFMDRETWQAPVHGIAKSQMWLNMYARDLQGIQWYSTFSTIREKIEKVIQGFFSFLFFKAYYLL